MMIDHRLDRIHLSAGSHPNPEAGICVMEAASMLAGEPFSDTPACVSPVIAAFLRSWNDSLRNKDRQMLRPYALRVIGTAADTDIELQRAYLALDWLVRANTVTWLRQAGVVAHADAVERLDPLRDASSAQWAKPTLQAAKDAAWKAARDAARDGIKAGAGAGAGASAWEAARQAARASAWAAAWEGAGEVVWEGSGEAAWAAVRAVAWEATGRKFHSTVVVLQRSAVDLLDRLIAVKPGLWTPDGVAETTTIQTPAALVTA